MVYQMELEKPMQAEVDAYNEKLEAFRPSYEKYVAERDEFELFPHQFLALESIIRNTGGRPAEAVKLSLQLPEGVTVADEDDVPKEPTVPVGPKLPGRQRGIYADTEQFDSLTKTMAPTLAAEALYSMPELRIPGPPRDVSGPDSSSGDLRFGVRLLSNFDEAILPRCFLRFLTPAAVRSFGLKYSLRAHSLPKLVEGELHVVISTDGGAASGEE